MILAGKGEAGLSLGSINSGAFRDLEVVVWLQRSLTERRLHLMLRTVGTFALFSFARKFLWCYRTVSGTA